MEIKSIIYNLNGRRIVFHWNRDAEGSWRLENESPLFKVVNMTFLLLI